MTSGKKHILSVLSFLFFTILLLATSVSDPEKAEDASRQIGANDLIVNNGKRIFNTYCIHCHTSTKKSVTDNLLMSALDRLPKPTDEYFIRFVGDSKLLRENGDTYARFVHVSSGSLYNHKFNQLFSRKEFEDLLAFIQQQTVNDEGE